MHPDAEHQFHVVKKTKVSKPAPTRVQRAPIPFGSLIVTDHRHPSPLWLSLIMDKVVLLKTKSLPCSRSHLHSALIISLWYIGHQGSAAEITWLVLNNKSYKNLKEI